LRTEEEIKKLDEYLKKYPYLKDYDFLQKNMPKNITNKEEADQHWQNINDSRKELLEEHEKNRPILELKTHILEAFKMRDTAEAKELMVVYITSTEHIYSIRQPNKSEMWIYKEGIYIPFAETYIKETIENILGSSTTPNYCVDVMRRIEAQTFISQEEFFKENIAEIVPVQNGLLNILTRELKPFNPKLKFFNKLPIKYDPELDCPNILNHFKETLSCFEDSLVMQEMFGYCLYKKYKYEKAFMFHGSGRNGKSKTLELLKYFLSPKNCTCIPLEIIDKDINALSNFFGKMVNICPDMSSTTLNQTSNFKALTGGDMISAHRKYQLNIEFVNYAKMIFGCNTLPITKDPTVAFWKRWVLFDFPYTFVDQKDFDLLSEKDRKNVKIADKDLMNKISTEKELSGLLNWALDGFKRLNNASEFSDSLGTKDIKRRWIQKSDSFTAFIMDNVEPDDFSSITKRDLSTAYRKYCIKNKARRMGDKRIKYVMEVELGSYDEMKKYTDSGENWTERAWIGIKFKEKNECKN